MICGFTGKELFIVQKMQWRIQDFGWDGEPKRENLGLLMRMRAHILVKGLGAFSGGGGGQLPLK